MGVLYQLGGGVGVNDGGHAGIDQEDACLLPQPVECSKYLHARQTTNKFNIGIISYSLSVKQ